MNKKEHVLPYKFSSLTKSSNKTKKIRGQTNFLFKSYAHLCPQSRWSAFNSWIISTPTKWNDKSWQKDFLNMKSHSPSDAKLLMGGVKGLKDAWRLGVLHVEYERLKKIQEEQQQQWQKKSTIELLE